MENRLEYINIIFSRALPKFLFKTEKINNIDI